ncbi:hypothetical protein BDB00DRAFT_875302 [Zychaea mexicana]|uniref:uncharacterized protein n=1 Tax=Zychaea mexicana TaxID=64656 RepID=UPI0022FE2BF2|nr:uncharacterized protein BDB00DRAFT_875302 [Zychaea mexicana]KAI9490402.1 hypothetical protein BDB00DRAFT_875302 [Zychaea mexicana]
MPNNSETGAEVAFVEDITEAITQLAKKDEQLTYQAVLECFYEHIINNVSDLDAFEKSKASWIRRINQVATICKVDLVHHQPTWKTVKEVLQKKLSSSPATEPASSSFKSPLSSSKSSSPLKTTLNEKDKVEFECMFATLDKSKFWILKASIEEAKHNDLPIDSIESVEEKVMKFAMSCNFKHPGHSFIVDLDDGNWDEVFSPAELEEMEEYGAPLLPPIDSKVSEKLDELAKLKTAKEAYNFACRLDHDPEEEPLMAWLMMSISQTAYQFLKKNNLHISNYLEADQQYYL